MENLPDYQFLSAPDAADDNDSKNERCFLFSRREFDSMSYDVARMIVETQSCKPVNIQRHFSLGFSRVCRIIDQLERAGIVGPCEKTGVRQVLVRNVMSDASNSCLMGKTKITDVGEKFGGARKDLYEGMRPAPKKSVNTNSIDVEMFLSSFTSDSNGTEQLAAFLDASSKGKLWRAAQTMSQMVDCLLERYPDVSEDCQKWALGTAAIWRYRTQKDDGLISRIEEEKRHSTMCVIMANEFGKIYDMVVENDTTHHNGLEQQLSGSTCSGVE